MPGHALLVVANPSPDSFSHAMANVAADVLRARAYEVAWHDLYAEGFDPVQRTGEAENRSSSSDLVETHCRELTMTDLIIVCHPNWWGQPPAILKGWIDRVFRPGVAYDYPPDVGPGGIAVGLLSARCGIVFNTSNTPWERELAVFGNPLHELWRTCVFRFCGVAGFEQRVFGPMASSTAELRAAWLDEVRAVVEKHA